jgi:hypothetical protein
MPDVDTLPFGTRQGQHSPVRREKPVAHTLRCLAQIGKDRTSLVCHSVKTAATIAPASVAATLTASLLITPMPCSRFAFVPQW